MPQKPVHRVLSASKSTGHSTGPRTSEGKKRSSQNARTHGCTSRKLILPGERQEDFDALLQDWLDDFQPQAPTARELVVQTAQAHWLYLRVQKQCDLAEAGAKSQNPAEWTEAEWKLREHLGRYRTAAERSFHRALNVLEARRKSRMAESNRAEGLEATARKIELQHLQRLEQIRIADAKLALAQERERARQAEWAAKEAVRNPAAFAAKTSRKPMFGAIERENDASDEEAKFTDVGNRRPKKRGEEER